MKGGGEEPYYAYSVLLDVLHHHYIHFEQFLVFC